MDYETCVSYKETPCIQKKDSIFCITIVNLFQRVAALTLLTTKSYFQSTANYNDLCFQGGDCTELMKNFEECMNKAQS